ncbi:MAG TPA: hypothetical protein VH643_41045 [Gemmataceae bacterium]|jgi:hypothetical protein
MDGLLVVLVLAFITVVGHLIWVGIAAAIRFLFQEPPREKTPLRPRPADQQLLDLEITTRTIRGLLADGELDQATADRLEQSLEARRRALQPKPAVRAPAGGTPALRSAGVPPAEASVAQLQALLGNGAHPRDLPAQQRRAALACYRRLNNSQRAALNAPTLLALARLLPLAGMTSQALPIYLRLLDDRADVPDAARVALEAARLAVHAEQKELARRFLQRALAGVLSPSEDEAARRLLRRLEESVQAPAAIAAAQPQEILEALPVPPSEEVAVRPAPVQPPPATLPSPAIISPPRRPRRSLTNLLAAFMEERNILWGELAGGTLIVGCSIALVITLWHSLEDLPYFPFLLFAGITAALFGAGEYTLHHWKLESTSRGLLVIALLLAPLNLLVLADPSLGPANTALEWIFKSAAILLALGMVRLAGRDLIGVGVLPGPIDRRWLFMLAIVGAAGSQLLVPRLLDEAHPVLYVALGCVPVACHLLACGAVVAGLARARSRSEGRRLEVRQANALFVFLGLVSFALFVAFGFLLSRSGEMALALPRLAVPFAWVGVPILAGGLLVRRGLPHEEGGTRTTGTAVAFTGLTLMLSAVVLAWPQPWAVLLVCLGNAAILSVLAFRWQLPHAHAVALPSAALAVLIVVQFALGNLAVPAEASAGEWLTRQLLSPSSSIVLAILMTSLAIGAEGLARAGRRPHALSYVLGSGVLGVAALLITAWHGVESPWPAAFVHGMSAMCALAMYVRWRHAALPYTGLGLLVAASLWGLWAVAPDNLAVWGFVLALESIALSLVSVWSHPLRGACRDVGAVTAVLALGLAVFSPGFPAQGLHTGTAAALALTAFVLAGVFRRLELAWVGSTFVFAALAHLLMWDLDAGAVPRPLLMALLTHATLALLGALVLRARGASDGTVLQTPLADSAQLTSLLAVPLLFVPGVAALTLAGYTLWLAVLWLLVAGMRRSPGWFTAFQAALCMAVVFAVRAWLPAQEGFDPRGLQVYGIALGLLGFAWIAARMALSSSARVRELWEAPWPSLDRVILGTLVIGQFALALWGVAPGTFDELTPAGYVALLTWPSTTAHAHGPGAWILLGILAVVLLAALRERGRTSIVLGLLVLAVTVPLLAAGSFASDLAAASALRWGLALCYLTCSALVWLRRSLTRVAESAGVTLAPDSSAVLCTHGLLGIVAVSVMFLTTQVALLGFAGLRPSGPAPQSIFATMGWVVSNVVPLVILTVGLVGHAVRERSPGYAFVGGLVANISVTGGYALAVVTSGRHLDTAEIFCLGQLTSLTAALWALGWQASRRWVYAWREVTESDGYVPAETAAPLMFVQLALAMMSQLLLVGSGVYALAELGGTMIPQSTAVGSPLGWLALLATLATLIVWYLQRRGSVPWGMLYIGGLAIVALLACTIERTWAGSGFYILLLAWPVYVLFWSILPLLNVVNRSSAGGRAWLSFAVFRNTTPLILLPCIANILWALNAAVVRQDYLWAAAAVSFVATAAALLAVGRRSPGLAFLAGLGANLATSLCVWRLYHPAPPSWVSLGQANVLASSSVALVWLGVRRWLGEQRPRILLTIQALLGLVLHTILLLLPLLRLDAAPDTPLGPLFAAIGSLVGWTALLVSSIATYWYLSAHNPRGRLHILGITGLSAGVLAACTISPWDTGGWQSFHVLLLIWCILGVAATLAGVVVLSLRFAGGWSDLLTPRAWRRWLEGIGMAILVIVLPNCWRDPLRPIVPAAAVAAVSVMAGSLALWTRRQHYVWISGLLVDLIGLLFWSAWGSLTVHSFLLMNALGLAVASGVWTFLDLTYPLSRGDAESPSILRRTPLPFAHFAANLSLAFVVLVVSLLLGEDLASPGSVVFEPLSWPCLAAVGAALVIALWDRRAAFARPGLYVLGLAAVGLALHDRTRSPAALGWSAAVVLAGYATVTSVIYRIFNRSPDRWLFPAQACVGTIVITLSLWMCLSFSTLVDRLAGPAAVLLLVPAVVLMIRRAGSVRDWLRPAALALGALAAAEVGWACPDPAGAAPWLHRNVLLMVALAAMTALYGVALPRWLARDAEWVRCARRVGPLLGVLASLTLLALLVQEFRLYNAATRRTPMLWPEILVVIFALVTLMVSGVRFAVVPGRDPFGLSERGRTIYVYAVELLLVLFFLHLRLTVPELFRGWLSRYWMFAAMMIAFAGVGLSEFFERRRLRVLAEPLQRTGVFLPLLPLLGFWVRPLAPTLPRLLQSLMQHNPGLNTYAKLWLLVCGLYAFVSLTRRSFLFALLAALAANFALWSLLAHHGIAFLLHPQCWLIPPALIVLAAEHLNRERLRPELSSGLRYLGISLIYVSSTADLFLAGLGDVVLSIVLAVLSLAGVLLGILFRVRAFLFLGIGFLFLDVFTMIWYAAVDRYQTWIWWVSGIVLGAAILTLFAVFEKRRNDVLHLLEEIKSWD